MTTYLLSGRERSTEDAILRPICRVEGDTEYHRHLAWAIRDALYQQAQSSFGGGPGREWAEIMVTKL